MPSGLKRFQREGDDHFITFSCYRREPYFATAASKDIFLDTLELTRKRHNFEVLGYVVMPEHVHLLVREPLDYETPLSKAIHSLKLSVSKRLSPRPFWQARYYDFNVFTHNKRMEKLKYMHRNPVTRGLVERPEDWSWSSYSHYLLDDSGPVRISGSDEERRIALRTMAHPSSPHQQSWRGPRLVAIRPRRRWGTRLCGVVRYGRPAIKNPILGSARSRPNPPQTG